MDAFPELNSLVVVTGPDWNNRDELVGRVGRVVSLSAIADCCEVVVDDTPGEFLPFRGWVAIGHLEPYTPAPRDDVNALERWLSH